MLTKRIKQQRKLLKLTQTELADRACVSQAMVSRIEDGKARNPKFYDVQKIAIALGVTSEYLSGVINSMKPYDTIMMDKTFAEIHESYCTLSECQRCSLRDVAETFAVEKAI